MCVLPSPCTSSTIPHCQQQAVRAAVPWLTCEDALQQRWEFSRARSTPSTSSFIFMTPLEAGARRVQRSCPRGCTPGSLAPFSSGAELAAAGC